MGINLLRNTLSVVNARAIYSLVLRLVYYLFIWAGDARYTRARTSADVSARDPGRAGPDFSPSHHHLRSAAPSSSAILKSRNPASHRNFTARRRGVRVAGYVDEVLAPSMWITRTRRLRGQELVEARPSTCLAVTAMLSHEECEPAASVIKAAVTKVLAKRK